MTQEPRKRSFVPVPTQGRDGLVGGGVYPAEPETRQKGQPHGSDSARHRSDPSHRATRPDDPSNTSTTRPVPPVTPVGNEADPHLPHLQPPTRRDPPLVPVTPSPLHTVHRRRCQSNGLNDARRETSRRRKSPDPCNFWFRPRQRPSDDL